MAARTRRAQNKGKRGSRRQDYLEACLEAEALLDASPGLSAVGSRRALDLAVKWLCRNIPELRRPVRESLNDHLTSRPFQQVMPSDVMRACHSVRNLGNKVAHTGSDVTYEQAEQAIADVSRLIRWIDRTYPDDSVSAGGHRICMRCGSMAWRRDVECPACNSSYLMRKEGDPSLRSALLLICSERADLLQDADKLRAAMADASPNLFHDEVLVDALCLSLETDTDKVRELLAENYPSDVIEDVESSLFVVRRYARNPMKFAHNPRDVDADWRLIVRKRGELPEELQGQPDDARERQSDLRAKERTRTAHRLADARSKRTKAVAFYHGNGVERDRQKAIALLRQAARQGDALAAYDLGACYYNGIGVRRDLSESERHFAAASAGGCARADYALGLQYSELWPAEAVGRFHTAANAGIVDGMTWLAGHYTDKYQLHHYEAYRTEAERLSALAEKKDPASTRRAKGMHSYFGRTVAVALSEDGYVYRTTNDPGDAARCFQEGACMGDGESMYDLGVCCLEGTGAQRNEAAAVRLFAQAALKGCAAAEYALGFCLLTGTGLGTSAREATRHLQVAADLDDSDAQLELGKCYLSGKGVAADRDVANCYLQLAADQGVSEAEEILASLDGGTGGVTSLLPPRPPRIKRPLLPIQ